jgi:hypothetical protein
VRGFAGEGHLTDADKKLIEEANELAKQGYIDPGVNNSLVLLRTHLALQ